MFIGKEHCVYGSACVLNVLSTAAGAPINVTAVQGSDPSAIVISWTAPVSGANVTGYRIYHQTEGDQGSVNVDAGVTSPWTSLKLPSDPQDTIIFLFLPPKTQLEV